MAKVGLAVLATRLGTGGGADVSTRGMVEAVADYGAGHQYTILVTQSARRLWDDRRWPANVQFVSLYDGQTDQGLAARLQRRALRTLGLPLPERKAPPDRARAIDALGLDVIYYPRMVISPLSVQTPCVLKFADMAHEFYPELFRRELLQYRAEKYRPSVDKAVRIIAPSRFTKQTLIEKYSVPPVKITVLPHGIAPGMGRAGQEQVRLVRARYHLPDNFIFYPANPWPHKNHARLMAALHIMRQSHGDCPWLVLSGRLQSEMQDPMALAAAEGVEDRVIDLGFVAARDLPALYTAARLLVFPSLFEGFGNPLVEAMACGCPIAAADATSIPEVTNGAALLFNAFDPEQMAEAIQRVLYDEDLRHDLATRAAAQLHRFSWPAIARQLVSVFAEVAQGLSC